MTRKEALTELLAKVEAGELTIHHRTIYHALGADAIERFMRALHGSLDAAKALHEAVLPGWPWSIRTLATDAVQVWTNFAYGLREPGYIGTTKDNPARAWLIAILRALIAQEERE